MKKYMRMLWRLDKRKRCKAKTTCISNWPSVRSVDHVIHERVVSPGILPSIQVTQDSSNPQIGIIVPNVGGNVDHDSYLCWDHEMLTMFWIYILLYFLVRRMRMLMSLSWTFMKGFICCKLSINMGLNSWLFSFKVRLSSGGDLIWNVNLELYHHLLRPNFMLFLEKFVPQTLRDLKKDEFMDLEKGGISMVLYEAKLHTMCRYAT